jgi:hypothetical protein
MEDHPMTIGSSIAKNRHEQGYLQLLKKHFGTPSKTFDQYEKMLVDSVKDVTVMDNTHLPMLIESIVPEAVSMIDLFEDQIAKAARSIQDNMTKESALPDVGKLEAELETERSRLKELRETRVEEEKKMSEKFRLSEMARVEMEREAQEKLEQVNMERIAAEEKRISQEQKAAERLALEEAKSEEARFTIQQQQIAFQKERLELQQREDSHSDSVSEASDIDLQEHEGWEQSIAATVQATDKLEEEAEQQTILESVAQSKPATQDEEGDASSVFSDFSLELDD